MDVNGKLLFSRKEIQFKRIKLHVMKIFIEGKIKNKEENIGVIIIDQIITENEYELMSTEDDAITAGEFGVKIIKHGMQFMSKNYEKMVFLEVAEESDISDKIAEQTKYKQGQYFKFEKHFICNWNVEENQT